MDDLQIAYRSRGIRQDDIGGKINLLYELMPGSQRVKAAYQLKDIVASGGGLADRFMDLAEFMPDQHQRLNHLEQLYESMRQQRLSGEKVVVSTTFPDIDDL